MLFSTDGLNWKQETVTYDAARNVRDPSLAKIGSKYFLAHTCKYGLSDTALWCFSSSTDLQTFANVSQISTAAFSATLHTWAPEWVKNADNSTYLDGSSCPHLAMVATNGTTQFGIIEQHPTNNCSDPSQAGTTWSVPVALTQMDTHMIDPFVIWDGAQFTMWYVDLVLSTNQSLQYGTAATLTGTYTKQTSGANWSGFQNGGAINQEGPALYCETYAAGACSLWRIYFDMVPAPPGDLLDGQIFYSEASSFAGPWSTTTNIITPQQSKHGTVIPFP